MSTNERIDTRQQPGESKSEYVQRRSATIQRQEARQSLRDRLAEALEGEQDPSDIPIRETNGELRAGQSVIEQLREQEFKRAANEVREKTVEQLSWIDDPDQVPVERTDEGAVAVDDEWLDEQQRQQVRQQAAEEIPWIDDWNPAQIPLEETDEGVLTVPDDWLESQKRQRVAQDLEAEYGVDLEPTEDLVETDDGYRVSDDAEKEIYAAQLDQQYPDVEITAEGITQTDSGDFEPTQAVKDDIKERQIERSIEEEFGIPPDSEGIPPAYGYPGRRWLYDDMEGVEVEDGEVDFRPGLEQYIAAQQTQERFDEMDLSVTVWPSDFALDEQGDVYGLTEEAEYRVEAAQIREETHEPVFAEDLAAADLIDEDTPLPEDFDPNEDVTFADGEPQLTEGIRWEIEQLEQQIERREQAIENFAADVGVAESAVVIGDGQLGIEPEVREELIEDRLEQRDDIVEVRDVSVESAFDEDIEATVLREQPQTDTEPIELDQDAPLWAQRAAFRYDAGIEPDPDTQTADEIQTISTGFGIIGAGNLGQPEGITVGEAINPAADIDAPFIEQLRQPVQNIETAIDEQIIEPISGSIRDGGLSGFAVTPGGQTEIEREALAPVEQVASGAIKTLNPAEWVDEALGLAGGVEYLGRSSLEGDARQALEDIGETGVQEVEETIRATRSNPFETVGAITTGAALGGAAGTAAGSLARRTQTDIDPVVPATDIREGPPDPWENIDYSKPLREQYEAPDTGTDPSVLSQRIGEFRIQVSELLSDERGQLGAGRQRPDQDPVDPLEGKVIENDDLGIPDPTGEELYRQQLAEWRQLEDTRPEYGDYWAAGRRERRERDTRDDTPTARRREAESPDIGVGMETWLGTGAGVAAMTLTRDMSGFDVDAAQREQLDVGVGEQVRTRSGTDTLLDQLSLEAQLGSTDQAELPGLSLRNRSVSKAEPTPEPIPSPERRPDIPIFTETTSPRSPLRAPPFDDEDRDSDEQWVGGFSEENALFASGLASTEDLLNVDEDDFRI